VYDRRGLTFENIDSTAFTSSSGLIGDLQVSAYKIVFSVFNFMYFKRWYSDCVGAIYIIDVNFIFWVAYQVSLHASVLT
jgi:hypothetical protein